MGRKAESEPRLILQPHISGGKFRMVMQWTICDSFPLFVFPMNRGYPDTRMNASRWSQNPSGWSVKNSAWSCPLFSQKTVSGNVFFI